MALWRPARPSSQAQVGVPIALAFYNADDGFVESFENAAVGQMWVDILYTTTGGRTWKVMVRNLSLWDGPNALVMTGPDEAWLVNGSMEAPAVTVLHTTDGGRHWTRRAEDVPGHAVGIAAVDLRPDALGGAVLMVSLAGVQPRTNIVADQAITPTGQWGSIRRLPNEGLPKFLFGNRGLSAVYWSLDTQWVLAESTANGPVELYRYDDAAGRWLLLPTPASPQQIVLAGPTTGYLATNARLWKTVNGGAAWVALPPL
ncbi:MAG: hypothetical protein OWU84_01480 [Firmicutes bacterium]|nr:hypothetical protein [Bacillota bacterium]